MFSSASVVRTLTNASGSSRTSRALRAASVSPVSASLTSRCNAGPGSRQTASWTVPFAKSHRAPPAIVASRRVSSELHTASGASRSFSLPWTSLCSSSTPAQTYPSRSSKLQTRSTSTPNLTVAVAHFSDIDVARPASTLTGTTTGSMPHGCCSSAGSASSRGGRRYRPMLSP